MKAPCFLPAPPAGPPDVTALPHRLSPDLLALVQRARDGDFAAQSELVRRYTTRISAFVRPIICQPNAVEDVVQMVFIKLARRIGALRDPETFEAWLLTLARNTSLDFIRRTRCRPTTVPEDGIFGQTPEADSNFTVKEILDALEFALAHLSPKDRRLVSMIVHGSSYRAAAESEGLSVGAVKLRLNRVRPFLRASVGGAIGLRARRAEPERERKFSRVAA